MKRKKLRFDALQFDTNLEIINKENLMSAIIGGSGSSSWECVFKTLDYLDGNGNSNWFSYYQQHMYAAGTDAQINGGVSSSDFSMVGGFANLDVQLLGSGSGVTITGSGTTTDGKKIMMLIPGANGNTHAVAVDSYYQLSTGAVITYWDETLNRYDQINNGAFVEMYSVSSR